MRILDTARPRLGGGMRDDPMRMSAWTAAADPRSERADRGGHRRQQRPRAGHRARAGARRGDGRADRARRAQGRRGAGRRSRRRLPRRSSIRGSSTSRASTRCARSPPALDRRPPADRPPGQQRRGDDAAALGDRRRLRAPVRHQPPRPLRAHRPAARRARRGRRLAGGHRLQPRAPARASSTSTTCSRERGYSPRSAYQQSKFANAVFGLELDRRLRAAGLPVISVLAHPGYSATNLQSTGPDRRR